MKAPVERNELSKKMPKRFTEMLNDYEEYKTRVNMLEVSDDYHIINNCKRT